MRKGQTEGFPVDDKINKKKKKNPIKSSTHQGYDRETERSNGRVSIVHAAATNFGNKG